MRRDRWPASLDALLEAWEERDRRYEAFGRWLSDGERRLVAEHRRSEADRLPRPASVRALGALALREAVR